MEGKINAPFHDWLPREISETQEFDLMMTTKCFINFINHIVILTLPSLYSYCLTPHYQSQLQCLLLLVAIRFQCDQTIEIAVPSSLTGTADISHRLHYHQ